MQKLAWQYLLAAVAAVSLCGCGKTTAETGIGQISPRLSMPDETNENQRKQNENGISGLQPGSQSESQTASISDEITVTKKTSVFDREYDSSKSFAENYSMWEEQEKRPKYNPSEWFDASGWESFSFSEDPYVEETEANDINIEIENDLNLAGIKDGLTAKASAEMSLQKCQSAESYRESIKDRINSRNKLGEKMEALTQFADSKGISEIPDELLDYEMDKMESLLDAGNPTGKTDEWYEEQVKAVFSYEPAALAVLKKAGMEFTKDDLDRYSDELLDAYGFENLRHQAKELGTDFIIVAAETAKAGDVLIGGFGKK